MKKLTPRSKNWIFYNITKFHRDDPYLKYLNSEVIISELKLILNKSIYVEDLDNYLQRESFLKPYRFYRKEGKSFIYPCLRDQVISLIECWDEMKVVYSSFYKGNENEYQHPEDEPFYTHAPKKDFKLKRKTFGNKANVNSSPRLHIKDSIHKHLMSSNRYIKCGFNFEYNFFKLRCLNELKKIEDRKSHSYFIQTDLKSFFHNLQISTILQLINKYHLPKTTKWLSQISTTFPEEGLPIGWILSGLVSDLCLIQFSKHIERKSKQICKATKISSFTMINYVDDLIFFVRSQNPVNKDSFLKIFCDEIQNELDNVFEDSIIKIHEPTSPKTKFLEINKNSAVLLRTNWHEIDLFTSLGEEGVNKKWSALDDFLLPSDNDLILNEKVQFFHNLKILKQKIDSEEINTLDQFNPFLDKILYKMSVDKKYLPTIFDLVFSFLIKEELANSLEPLSRKIWKFLIDIEDFNSLDLIIFLKYLLMHISKENIKTSIFEELSKKAVKIVSTRFKGKTDDLKLISAFFSNYYLDNPQLETALCKDAKIDDVYFYKMSCAALNYNKIIYQNSSRKIRGNEIIAITIITNVYKKEKTAKSVWLALDKISSRIANPRFRKEFIQRFVYFSSYLFIPRFNKTELEETISYLKKHFKSDDALLREIINLHEQYEELFDLFMNPLNESLQTFIRSLKTENEGYNYKAPSIFKFNLLKNKSPISYVYYKEILTCLLFSCPTYSNAARIVLFQYAPIESAVFISWKCIPRMYNSVSHISLGMIKSFLQFKTSNILMKAQDRFIFPISKFGTSFINSSSSKLSFINLESFEKFLIPEGETFKEEEIRLMVANIFIDINKDFDPTDHFRLNTKAKIRVNKQIMRALRSAATAKCTVICFPELTLPQDFLGSYLKFAGDNNIILIGGTEYFDLSSNVVANATVVSFPTEKTENPTSKSFHNFVQFKNNLSIKEIYEFDEANKKYKLSPPVYLAESNEISIFVSERVHNFSVLTCSDFISLDIKNMLQGLVQMLFVPAMNYDNTTYYHVSQSAIRELYCICVVCNNSFMGGSHVCAPLREEHERTLFKIEGKSLPKTHHLVINPSIIAEVQKIGEDKNKNFETSKHILTSGVKLSKFKQVPPDWSYIRAKKKIA